MTTTSRDLHAVVVEMKGEAVYFLLPLEAGHVLDFLMRNELSMSVTERPEAIEVAFWKATASE